MAGALEGVTVIELAGIRPAPHTRFPPVLSLGQAPRNPDNPARATFVDEGGVVHPAPAPRFSASPADPVSLAGR